MDNKNKATITEIQNRLGGLEQTNINIKVWLLVGIFIFIVMGTRSPQIGILGQFKVQN